MDKDPDLLEEYDFTRGIRGKDATQYAEGTNVVLLDPDVAACFPDPDEANDALRHLAAILHRHQGPPPGSADDSSDGRNAG
jgi:hypothetical protein